MGQHAVLLAGSVEVAATAGVAVADWLMLRLQRVLRGLIELVVEDGSYRAVGERADLDGARCSRIQTLGGHRTRQPQNAEASPEALLGVRASFQDQRAQDADRGADRVSRTTTSTTTRKAAAVSSTAPSAASTRNSRCCGCGAGIKLAPAGVTSACRWPAPEGSRPRRRTCLPFGVEAGRLELRDERGRVALVEN